MDRTGKRRNKTALQQELALPVRDDVPLIGVGGALDPSSGLDLVARIVSRLMRNDVQVAVFGEAGGSEPTLARVLQEHARRWPDRLAVRPDSDDAAIHRAIGGSDFVLVPPKQGPGGAMQQRAHRYGALPIGLASASVADSVVDCDAKLSTGNGFLYDAPTDDAALAAVQRAIAAFTQRDALERLRGRALRTDHGWDRPAYLYERLYESIASGVGAASGSGGASAE
jgi:starch synthase